MKKTAPPNDPCATEEAPTGEMPQGRHDGGTFSTLLKYALKIGVTAAIVAVLVHTSRKHGTFEGFDFRSLNWAWLAAAFVLYIVHLFVNAWRWRLLLAYRAIPCSLFSAFSLTTQSFFFSLVMPGGAIGGDVIRAGFLAYRVPKGQKFDGVFTILMDRFTGMIGIFLTAFLALPFSWRYLQDAEPRAKLLTYVLLAGSAAGLAVAAAVLMHRTLEKLAVFRWGESLADRLSRGFFSRMLEALDSYRDAKKELVLCVLASIAGVNFVLGLCFYCVCLAFTPGLAPLFAPIVAAILGAALAGVQDCDVSALAPTLVMTAVIIAGGLFGGFFFLFDNPARKRAPAPDAP
ncbi:MAG: flippase-like domain-containing protein [Lentisphaeria bacterium]|nr:flippase-like domain-containing protein [Lentisphaeria bacterium]